MSHALYAGPRARRPALLECVWLDDLPHDVLDHFEAAFTAACKTVAFFFDEDADTWRIEGVREQGEDDATLISGLALAALVSGYAAPPFSRAPVEAEGWLARTAAAFPEQPIGTRFLIRPTHVPDTRRWDRKVLKLDAGVAFGSGEHASTQGCLMALEAIAHRRPRRVLDLGSGSGILAMASVHLFHRPVLATDIDPWSVRIIGENAIRNGMRNFVRGRLADGWKHRRVAAEGPYDLVFANILARPLCAMARSLASSLAPGGTAILAGLLNTQARRVLAAHRRCGLTLERRLVVGAWTTLVLRAPQSTAKQ
ncbi:ribosomal protein L11 methyltransferase [Humitalea rosea]|uniref:Ribosomal protein L11 methyltransferase n=1 Tax=Humitalea rosea TaxID=990373 RepID=A0A2W7KKS9_9PROT|nr:50S ribosomal protein L11 methyltransferase [Humitalea rosea]PZW48745.1 ribosomal protein L11 methyltransferase [Humitalea rosea]